MSRNDRDGNATKEVEDGLRKISGRVWVPDAALELQLRLFVVEHCETSGAIESKFSVLKEFCNWEFVISTFPARIPVLQ